MQMPVFGTEMPQTWNPERFPAAVPAISRSTSPEGLPGCVGAMESIANPMESLRP
jgi:hypothetical protein